LRGAAAGLAVVMDGSSDRAPDEQNRTDRDSSAVKHGAAKIGIIGSRGIPARYGGFETFAEGISTRLAAKGYEVYVSCEGGKNPKPPAYEGVRLFYFPLKPFCRLLYETIYDIYALVVTRTCYLTIALGYGAGFFFFIPKLFGKRIIVNVDGLERRRAKYNKLEKVLLYLSEKAAVLFSDALVADSREVEAYYRRFYNKKEIVFIPYGVSRPRSEPWDPLKLQLLPADAQRILQVNQCEYYLVIARLEPENNLHVILEGFLTAQTRRKLIVLGDTSSKSYRNQINRTILRYGGQDRVILAGAIYNALTLNMLRQNSFAHFHGHSAGGTNPSLLEAMAAKCIIVAHDNVFNREVCGDYALYFGNASELSSLIELLERDGVSRNALGENARARAKERYSWDTVVESYELLFGSLKVPDATKTPHIDSNIELQRE
jgi:glycosyltransferase involved in cell wall biosynthesis